MCSSRSLNWPAHKPGAPRCKTYIAIFLACHFGNCTSNSNGTVSISSAFQKLVLGSKNAPQNLRSWNYNISLIVIDNMWVPISFLCLVRWGFSFISHARTGYDRLVHKASSKKLLLWTAFFGWKTCKTYFKDFKKIIRRFKIVNSVNRLYGLSPPTSAFETKLCLRGALILMEQIVGDQFLSAWIYQILGLR